MTRWYGGVLQAPPGCLTEVFSKWKKIVHSLTLFGVRYKQIPSITIFTDSFKNLFEYFESAFESAKLFLLFHVNNVRNVLSSGEF